MNHINTPKTEITIITQTNLKKERRFWLVLEVQGMDPETIITTEGTRSDGEHVFRTTGLCPQSQVHAIISHIKEKLGSDAAIYWKEVGEV